MILIEGPYQMSGYTDDDVARLLAISSRETIAARRWLPLLAVCTGARIGELAQLWDNNVGEDVIRIAPADDGGMLKGPHTERVIPTHPALIAAGFVTFVKKRGDGPLFYKRSSRHAESRHASKGVTNHLATWIRKQGFTDPRKAPAHAFRHWFKTKCSEIGIPDSVADAIQGHVSKDVADRFGTIDIDRMAEAIKRIPIEMDQSALIHESSRV